MAERLAQAPPARPGQPDWSRHGAEWPQSSASSFWRVGRTAWHVQTRGDGPDALLIHGTGASTHSWSGLMPLMASAYRVTSIDLPGHGFTRPPPGFVPSLANMTAELADLVEALDRRPSLLVGHSAGAAIAVRLASLGHVAPSHLVSLNGALRPFPGPMRHFAPSIAKTLTFGGVAATLLAQAARDRTRVERLLQDTGGAPSQNFIDRYQALFSCSAHVSSTLSMMANWDLTGIERDLAGLKARVCLVAGAEDTTISPAEAPRLAALSPRAVALRLPGLGHLAHEQEPGAVWSALSDFLSPMPAAH
ncbi:MAG: alpha/beta fold hydrolase BchO [Pseudomonadota bacterium]